MGNRRGAFRVLVEVCRVRDCLENAGVDGRIILKLGLQEVRWWLGLD